MVAITISRLPKLIKAIILGPRWAGEGLDRCRCVFVLMPRAAPVNENEKKTVGAPGWTCAGDENGKKIRFVFFSFSTAWLVVVAVLAS